MTVATNQHDTLPQSSNPLQRLRAVVLNYPLGVVFLLYICVFVGTSVPNLYDAPSWTVWAACLISLLCVIAGAWIAATLFAASTNRGQMLRKILEPYRPLVIVLSVVMLAAIVALWAWIDPLSSPFAFKTFCGAVALAAYLPTINAINISKPAFGQAPGKRMIIFTILTTPLSAAIFASLVLIPGCGRLDCGGALLRMKQPATWQQQLGAADEEAHKIDPSAVLTSMFAVSKDYEGRSDVYPVLRLAFGYFTDSKQEITVWLEDSAPLWKMQTDGMFGAGTAIPKETLQLINISPSDAMRIGWAKWQLFNGGIKSDISIRVSLVLPGEEYGADSVPAGSNPIWRVSYFTLGNPDIGTMNLWMDAASGEIVAEESD